MTTHFAEFAPTDFPRIEYSTVDDDQAAHISEAMTLPENQARFEVTFIPIDTPEARRAAAEEWAAYQQAKGDVAASERGAYMVMNSRDESPEAFLRLIQKNLYSPRHIAAHALSKIVCKDKDASVYDLMRTYYEPASE